MIPIDSYMRKLSRVARHTGCDVDKDFQDDYQILQISKEVDLEMTILDAMELLIEPIDAEMEPWCKALEKKISVMTGD